MASKNGTGGWVEKFKLMDPRCRGKKFSPEIPSWIQFTIRTIQFIKESMIILHNKIIDDNDEDGNGDTDVQTTHLLNTNNIISECDWKL